MSVTEGVCFLGFSTLPVLLWPCPSVAEKRFFIWTWCLVPSSLLTDTWSFFSLATMTKAAPSVPYQSFCGHVFSFLLGKYLGMECGVIGCLYV